MYFLVDTLEVTMLSLPMYEIGTEKEFTITLKTEEDEALSGAYLFLSRASLVGKVFAKLSADETYVEVPGASDNSWYLGSVSPNSEVEIDVKVDFGSGDVNEFGNIYFSLCVGEGEVVSSLTISTLWHDNDGYNLPLWNEDLVQYPLWIGGDIPPES